MTQTIIIDSLVEYKGHYYTGADIKAMREWISDCQWGDVDDVSELSDFEVVRGVDDNYGGGLDAFIHECIAY